MSIVEKGYSQIWKYSYKISWKSVNWISL